MQQQALRDFHQALRNFFAGTHGRPTWRKARLHEGFRIVGAQASRTAKLNRKWARVHVPKVGWVRLRLSRAIPDAKSYRITRDRAGRWHLAFAAIPEPIPALGTGEVVGLDRGVTVSAALSTGDLLTCPGPSDREQERLKQLQRRLARCRRGSKRRRRVKAAIAKRLARAGRTLAGLDVTVESPPPEAIHERLEAVRGVLFLLFNEGYFSTTDQPILRELCRDAMLLAQLLAEHQAIATSETMALIALMCFNAARLESRLDADGRLVPLDEQDRSRWDAGLIRTGYSYLVRSTEMEALMASRYHLEAAIAAYDGDLLPGLYDDWVLPERERLRVAFADAAEELVEQRSERGDHQGAIRLAEDLRRHDPLREPTYRTLMRVYVRAGDDGSR